MLLKCYDIVKLDIVIQNLNLPVIFINLAKIDISIPRRDLYENLIHLLDGEDSPSKIAIFSQYLYQNESYFFIYYDQYHNISEMRS